MKAMVAYYDTFGRPEDVLRVEERTIDPPREGEVLVRMKLRPINPSDLIPITGAYAHRISLPDIPGYEGVGMVEAVGAGVSPQMLGQRVLPLRGEGTWQEVVRAPAQWVVPVPDEVRDTDAAQLYINPLTAWVICRERLRLQRSHVLLVNACGSSLGRIFAQLSQLIGFRLLAVTRNDSYTDELLRLGAEAVVDTSKVPLREAVMAFTGGKGADAAIDSVGGPDGTELAYCLRPGGELLLLGLLSGLPLDGMAIARETSVKPALFHLRHWNKEVGEEIWQANFRQLFTLVSSGRLQLMEPAATESLAFIQAAVRKAAARQGNPGKIMLT